MCGLMCCETDGGLTKFCTGREAQQVPSMPEGVQRLLRVFVCEGGEFWEVCGCVRKIQNCAGRLQCWWVLLFEIVLSQNDCIKKKIDTAARGHMPNLHKYFCNRRF